MGSFRFLDGLYESRIPPRNPFTVSAGLVIRHLKKRHLYLLRSDGGTEHRVHLLLSASLRDIRQELAEYERRMTQVAKQEVTQSHCILRLSLISLLAEKLLEYESW